jgi:hypothetical protein
MGFGKSNLMSGRFGFNWCQSPNVMINCCVYGFKYYNYQVKKPC